MADIDQSNCIYLFINELKKTKNIWDIIITDLQVPYNIKHKISFFFKYTFAISVLQLVILHD